MKKFLLAVVIVFTVTALAGVIFLMESTLPINKGGAQIVNNEKKPENKAEVTTGLKQFTSEEDFVSYLSSVPSSQNALFGNQVMRQAAAVGLDFAAPTALESTKTVSENRYSSTNVQVVGIDEPDIVKNDGQNIYISQDYFPIYAKPLLSTDSFVSYRYPYYQTETKVIKANPANDLKVLKKIPSSGSLLVDGNIIMIFEGNTVKGYDLVASSTDKELWKISLPNSGSLAGARLYNGKLYLASKQSIYSGGRPCPYEPFTTGEAKIIIPCTAIYHPITPVPTDIIYTVATFDPKTGQSINNTSFTGSNSYSVLYMSPESMYVTYYNPTDSLKFTYDFLTANQDLVPKEVLSKLGKLLSYDISNNSKQNELYLIIQNWQASWDKDEGLKIKNEFLNRSKQFLLDHMREYENTGIVKISLNDFKVAAMGQVPGQVLNQFSLDENNNNLRIATTIGESWFSTGISTLSQNESLSDVYILDQNLKQLGSVRDLGKGERIYSTRFIGDKGYVVTFRQTDPFYVLDLKDPKNPKLAGELKIPGYSGYLEQLKENLILGVGKEGGQVKLALFDVTDPMNPKESSKYLLDEFWSEALNDHHAFLKDDKHGIFFIPGSSGGYVFTYDNNQLSLKKAISEPGIKRSVYINDVFYIVSQNKLSAWKEGDWSKISELELVQTSPELKPIIY